MRILLGLASYLATADKNKQDELHLEKLMMDRQGEEEPIPYEEWAEPVVTV
jgi:hypothetical protein